MTTMAHSVARNFVALVTADRLAMDAIHVRILLAGSLHPTARL